MNEKFLREAPEGAKNLKEENLPGFFAASQEASCSPEFAQGCILGEPEEES